MKEVVGVLGMHLLYAVSHTLRDKHCGNLRAYPLSHHKHAVPNKSFASSCLKIRLQIVYCSSPYLDMARRTTQFSLKFLTTLDCDELAERLLFKRTYCSAKGD